MTLGRLLGLLSQDLLHHWALHQSLVPGSEDGELLLDIEVGDEPAEQRVPRHPCQISIRALLANEVWGLLLGEVRVNDSQDALDLSGVTFLGRRKLVLVEVAEPCLLAEVRTLTGHLEVKPLVGFVLLRHRGVAELVVGVVGFDEVLDDGTRLEK